MKNMNFDKEQYRGTIKQLMKVRGIRTISLDNYFKHMNWENLTNVHSVKINLQDGYVNIYNYGKNGRCGDVIEDASSDLYKGVYDSVLKIFSDEKNIPFKVRRNILVSMSR